MDEQNKEYELNMLFSKIFTSFFLSLAIFSTTYSVAGVFLYPRLIFGFLGFCTIFFIFNNKYLFKFFLLNISILLILVIPSLVHWNFSDLLFVEFLFFRGLFFSIYTGVFIVFVFDFFIKRNKIYGKYVWYFVVDVFLMALLLQFLFVVIHLVSEEARISYLSIVNFNEEWREMSQMVKLRFNGIGGISIYDTAITYSLICGIVLLRKTFQIYADKRILLLILISVFLAILHGRTGLMFLLMLWFFIFIDELFIIKIHNKLSLKILIAIAAVVFLIFSFVGYDAISDSVVFAMEIFNNFISGEGLRSASTDDLFENHLRWPGIDIFFYGTSFWIQAGFVDDFSGNHTDSGFLLLLNYGGILFITAFFLLFFFLLQCYAKLVSVSKSKINNTYLFLIYIFIIFFLTSWKGPIFLSESFMTSLFIMISLMSRYRGNPPSKPAS